jgi:hypothetical protein
MLFIDMVCVQWRYAGKNGHIIVRGTDDVLLCECVLVPPSQPPHATAPAVSGVCDGKETGLCCYYHTQICGGSRAISDTSQDSSSIQGIQSAPSACFALSVGVDVNKHPTVTILYKERFCEQERRIGSIDVCYNKLLFTRGYFADSVMKAQGYGVLLLCHSAHDHNHDNHHASVHRQPIRHLLNWRQCQLTIRQQVQALALQTAPATTTISEMASFDGQVRSNAYAADGDCTDQQWETSLYRALKASVSSTFNLLL